MTDTLKPRQHPTATPPQDPRSGPPTPPCGAEYDGPGWIISRRDRKCDRPGGHPGVHREYITGVWWPNPPTDDVPPRPLSDEDITDAVDAMTEPEVRAALRFVAGARPVEFAGAMWMVERQRTATCGGGCGL